MYVSVVTSDASECTLWGLQVLEEAAARDEEEQGEEENEEGESKLAAEKKMRGWFY